MTLPRRITVNGVTDSIAGWARRTGLARVTIRGRLNRGWVPKKAITKEMKKGPPNKYNIRIGDQFGLWTVVSYTKIKTKCGTVKYGWMCRCVCKKYCFIPPERLVSGRSMGCRRCMSGERADAVAGPVEAGKKYGIWTAIKRVQGHGNGRWWLIRCPEGHERVEKPDVIRVKCPNRFCKACQSKNSLRLAHPDEWRSWIGARHRCNDPNSHEYADYGGRGIKMCPEWDQCDTGFRPFYEHIGPKPGPEFTLNRIDNEGDYEPGNVCWSLPKTQSRNRRNTKMMTLDGQIKSLADWVEEYYGDYKSKAYREAYARTQMRLRNGWPFRFALLAPARIEKKGTGRIFQLIEDMREVLHEPQAATKLQQLFTHFEKAVFEHRPFRKKAV